MAVADAVVVLAAVSLFVDLVAETAVVGFAASEHL